MTVPPPFDPSARVPNTAHLVSHRSGAWSTALWVLAQLTLKPIYRVWPLNDTGVKALRLLDTIFTRLPRPRSSELEFTTLSGVPAEVSRPRRRATDQLAGIHILYMHGGGFLFCAPTTHRYLCSRLSDTLGVPVYSLRYRKLPAVGVGTAVDDAYRAYRALREHIAATDRIVVAGDSAGGFLAAKICELAHLDGLTAPAAFVGYSPQVDLDIDRHDARLLRNDAYQPLSAYLRAKKHWHRGPIPLRGTRCPADAPADMYPPTFLVAAEGELFETGIRALATSLHKAGQNVQTHIWRHQVHAFPVLDALLPESTHAIELTARFLRTTLAHSGDRPTTANA